MTTRDGRYSTYGLLNLALDHARLLIAVPVLSALLALGFATLRGPEFQARSTFMPESSQPSVGQLGGLAAQLGLGAQLLTQDESVDFYARLATSRATLAELAARTYRFPVAEGAPDTLEGTIPELLGIEGDSPEERLRIATAVLEERVQAETDRSAGVVGIRTVAPWGPLAVQLNRAALDAVGRFNFEKRRSSAAAERAFVEAQLEEAKADLQEAEDELQQFMEANRRYETWPELRFQADRLERRVQLVQQLYTSLAQSLQKARIEEVRNTPTITVVSPPENSAEKVTSRLRVMILGFLLGLALVVVYLFLREFAARQQEEAPAEYDDFRHRARRLTRFRRS